VKLHLRLKGSEDRDRWSACGRTSGCHAKKVVFAKRLADVTCKSCLSTLGDLERLVYNGTLTKRDLVGFCDRVAVKQVMDA
jgi:hypothetical protein